MVNETINNSTKENPDRNGHISMSELLSSETGYFDSQNLNNILFTGRIRSGKTEAAMKFVSEMIKERDSRFIIMGDKQEWRKIARYVSPDRFNFVSLGNPYLSPAKINVLKVTDDGTNEDLTRTVRGLPGYVCDWAFIISDLWCLYNNLSAEDDGSVLAGVIMELYSEIGFNEVTFPKVYNKYREMLLMPEGEDDPLLKSLKPFADPDSIQYSLFGCEEGLSIDEVIGESDDVTVFEGYGLPQNFANFIYGCIASRTYDIANRNNSGCSNDNPCRKTVLVIEEANSIIKSGKTFTERDIVFHDMARRASDLGLRIVAITPDETDMPSEFTNGRLIRFSFGQNPIGCCTCSVQPNDTDKPETLVDVEMLEGGYLSDDELKSILSEKGKNE